MCFLLGILAAPRAFPVACLNWPEAKNYCKPLTFPPPPPLASLQALSAAHQWQLVARDTLKALPVCPELQHLSRDPVLNRVACKRIGARRDIDQWRKHYLVAVADDSALAPRHTPHTSACCVPPIVGTSTFLPSNISRHIHVCRHCVLPITKCISAQTYT